MDPEIRLACAALNRPSLTSRKFRALFGLHPDTVSDLRARISVEMKAERVPYRALFWFLHWVRCYPSDDVASAIWSVDPKTYRKHRHTVLFAIHRDLGDVR